MEWNCKPVLTMLAVEMALGAMNVMIKKAIQGGMNSLVFITFRHLVATLFIAPIAFFHERKTRSKLTLEIFVYLFFSALFGGALTQYLFYIGLDYTTTTFACAFLNMSPVCTFLLALALRMEVVSTESKEGVARVLGTIVCFTGVLVLILYKGVALNKSMNTSEHKHSARKMKWLMGSMALLGGCVSWSAWFPLHLKVSNKYPHLYSCTAIVFFLSFLQAAALSLATQRGAAVWVLKKKLEIATVIYSGAVGSGLGFLGMSWCVEQRGPVFAAAFIPFIQIAAAVIDFAFLDEIIHLGSVLGSVLVVAGLYLLLWGKNKEACKASAEAKATTNSSQVNIDRENRV